MICADIYIEFVKPARALSIGVVPVTDEPTQLECMAWHFLQFGVKAANERIVEQMVENSGNAKITNAPIGSQTADGLVKAVKKAGAFRRVTASVLLCTNPQLGLGYFLTYPPGACEHPAEVAAWETMKLALDTASDWWNLPTSYTGVQEDDEDNLRETLRKAMLTLPVFPKFAKEEAK